MALWQSVHPSTPRTCAAMSAAVTTVKPRPARSSVRRAADHHEECSVPTQAGGSSQDSARRRPNTGPGDASLGVGFQRVQLRERVPQPGEMAKLLETFRILSTSQLDDDDSTISFDEWRTACIDVLRLDVQAAELERVWARLTCEQHHIPVRERRLDFRQFAKGATRTAFLQQVITGTLSASSRQFVIPSDYDYTKTTNDNYGCSATPRVYYGDYVDIREGRDYNYHVNYVKERQLWQDAVVKSVVVRTEPQVQPWVVYTCGPMGAGKGFTLRWMSKHGFFPLEHIAHIDPDYFKSVMVRACHANGMSMPTHRASPGWFYVCACLCVCVSVSAPVSAPVSVPASAPVPCICLSDSVLCASASACASRSGRSM